MFSKAASKSSNVICRRLLNLVSQSYLRAKKEDHHDIVMIRHAQSEFNKACEDYRQLHRIPYVWKQLCNHQGFDQTVLFNSKYLDCALTQRGKQQCKKTKKLMGQYDIDCILVSPQLRALQTCYNIFQDSKIPVIVEPLLVGPLRSCCDINKPTNTKKQLFPEYDFTPTDDYPELWYLDYLSKEHQQICNKAFEQKGLQTFEDQRMELVELLKTNKIYEDAKQYRKRIQNAKYKIAEYKQRYNNLGLVSHYYTIQYLNAKEYQPSGKPIYYIDVKNCTPYYTSVNELLAIQQAENTQEVKAY